MAKGPKRTSDTKGFTQVCHSMVTALGMEQPALVLSWVSRTPGTSRVSIVPRPNLPTSRLVPKITRLTEEMSLRQRRRIEPYLERLFGYAFSLTRNREDSADLVQDCALRALSARRTPRDEAAYRAWLFRILRNAWLDRARRPRLEQLGLPSEELVADSDVWIGDERRINTLTVRLGLAKLSLVQREIIALVDIVGLSYAETSEVLDLPRGTVMSRLSRARRALLEVLSKDGRSDAVDRLKRGAG